ncbi:hypothetical protein CP973_04290 [Streptomyces albofaciens JCM 4342]|uniref:hypothetical protein n=1 Tax=Streptomyces albofaciens TaxID=66866 RepID=UPI00123B729E|nr:hypothetical protein [Streptomyces albofaciens]KAA6221298.1 hypothetical protein CP973_04290 [Streptomyces albofaciens JCM 4342]
MSNVSSNTYTYTRVGAILHEIGMVTEEKMRSVLEEAATYADEEIDQYEAASALEEFGVAVSVHADDIDSIHYGYADLMEAAAEAAGGRVAITDVRLVEGEGDFEGGRMDTLTFERNGIPMSIDADHLADDYYDQGAACEAITVTAHEDDPRSWREVDFDREPHRGYDSIMVLATPEQARALEERLGFRFPE